MRTDMLFGVDAAKIQPSVFGMRPSNQKKGLPLVEAHAFGAEHGLAHELSNIEEKAKRSHLAEKWARVARKGCIVQLFRKREIFLKFVELHWSFATTDEGRKKLKQYESYRQRLLGSPNTRECSDNIQPSHDTEATPPVSEAKADACVIPEAVVPPFEGAKSLLARIKTIADLPERNHEDVVKELLLLLGFDSASVVFQIGRIDVCLRLLAHCPLCIFEVKRSIAKTSKRDGALRQAMDYAHKNGTEMVVVTDGDRYEIYDRRKGRDYQSMFCGKFRLTDFRDDDTRYLDMIRPTAFGVSPKSPANLS